MIDAPKKYFRLKPMGDVRLRNAYVITCKSFDTDEQGNVTEIRAEYLPETLGGKKPADGRKVKGIIHWLAKDHCTNAEVRLYDRLFKTENPASEENLLDALNHSSLTTIHAAACDKSLAQAKPEERFQFTRLGYFCADRYDHTPEHLVFNRITELKKTWK